jgi:hypothetical protein
MRHSYESFDNEADEFEMRLKQLRPREVAMDPMRIGFEAGRASMRFKLGCWRAAGCIALTFAVALMFLNRPSAPLAPQITMVSPSPTKAAPSPQRLEVAALFHHQSTEKFTNPYLGLRADVLENGLSALPTRFTSSQQEVSRAGDRPVIN